MSVLATNEMALVKTALTNIVLEFMSTSEMGRKNAMHSKLERAYDTAKHNARKCSQQAQAFGMVANSLKRLQFEEEAGKWDAVARHILEVLNLVNHEQNRKG
jgi:lipid A disaccharide synthetase